MKIIDYYLEDDNLKELIHKEESKVSEDILPDDNPRLTPYKLSIYYEKRGNMIMSKRLMDEYMKFIE